GTRSTAAAPTPGGGTRPRCSSSTCRRLPGALSMSPAAPGATASFLAARGWHVEGIDISAVGLAQARERAAGEGLDVGWIEADLDDPDALPPGPYDLVLMVRYVNRSLLPHLLTRLAPGGILLVEQHLETTEDVI